MSDLYVMQNEFGLIKIGRSTNVMRRMRALQGTEMCRIQLVGIVEGAGHLEESTHIALDDFRLIGEWFDGGEDARNAIIQLLDMKGDKWPFDLAAKDAIDRWLDAVEGRRFNQARVREFSRVAKHMAEVPVDKRTDSGRYFDTHIWVLVSRFS